MRHRDLLKSLRSLVTIAMLFVLMVFGCEHERFASTFYQYDTLQLTLIFDGNNTLCQFMLARSPDKHIKHDIPSNFGSLTIPLVGAFNIKFNSSVNVVESALGIPKSYYYADLDTCAIATLSYSFTDESFIDFTFINDSLVNISSNVKWVKLPQGLQIGVKKDLVCIFYGKPNNAGLMKSYISGSDLFSIPNLNFMVKTVKRKYQYLCYDTFNLTLNLDKDGKLEEWMLHRPFKKNFVSNTIIKFDSSAIPQWGAFGVKFNSSTKEAKKVLGMAKSYGFVNNDSFTITLLGWRFKDSSYINFSFRNDSLERISSNVRWARLPKGIKVGMPKDSIILRYGKPSFESTKTINFIYKHLR